MLQFDKVDKIIKLALEEDISSYDITTENVFNKKHKSVATVIAKENGIIAGLEVFKRVFFILDRNVDFREYFKDGDFVKNKDVIIEIRGFTVNLLKGERTALNFLQRLSGIASMANNFCEMVKGYNVKITDTRKTTPGLRHLEKYAVKVGGAYNHRYNLSDGVMIKDNHIKASGSIKSAVKDIRDKIPHTIKIEVETENMEGVKEALESGADIIMLDNMNLEQMKQAVDFIDKRALVEASGNVTLDTVREIAKTGVDIISSGALTHSVKAMDISMKMK